jgi:hypothetical protein
LKDEQINKKAWRVDQAPTSLRVKYIIYSIEYIYFKNPSQERNLKISTSAPEALKLLGEYTTDFDTLEIEPQ